VITLEADLLSAAQDAVTPSMPVASEPELEGQNAAAADSEELITTVQESPAVKPEDTTLTVTYLDSHQRYQLLDALPEVLSGNGQVETRVLDCQPFQPSPLFTFFYEQADDGAAVTLTSQSRQRSIPALAQPYLELRDELYPALPQIHDAWEQGDRAILLLEDRSELPLLVEFWQDPDLLPIQILHWMHEMTELWNVLESWSARQSLLELFNLRVDEDQVICLQQLHFDDPENPPGLTDLGRLWRQLYEQAQRIPIESFAYLCAELESGEISTLDELQNRFEAIADELQPSPPPFAVSAADYPAPSIDGSAVADDSNYGDMVDSSTADLEMGIPDLTLPSPMEASELPAAAQYNDDEEEEEDSTTVEGEDAPTVVLPMKLVSLDDAGRTDVGKQREHNEDFFSIQTQFSKADTPSGRTFHARGLYILCDGMGGHASGEVASALAVETLQSYFEQHWATQLPDESTIREAIVAANRAIYDLNQQSDRSGVGRMGTTLVLVLIQDSRVAVAHVGDSRLYQFSRNRGLEQITVDHEVGQREIQRGVEEAIAYARPDAYQLTQALGPRDEKFIDPDIQFLELSEDQLLLLCSDGLSDNHLLETHCRTHVEPLLSSRTNLEQGISQLIDLANQHNGHDNITAIVIRAKVRPNLDLAPQS
jgi:protein phosphatase